MSNEMSPEHAVAVLQAEELRDLLLESTRRTAVARVQVLQIQQQLDASQDEPSDTQFDQTEGPSTTA